MSDDPEAPSTPEGLHPRVRLVWAAGAVIGAAVLFVVGRLGTRVAAAQFGLTVDPAVVPAVAAAVGVLGVTFAVLRYRIWRFELQDDALYLERGVLTRVETSVPYVRVQHIDTQRGPVERLVGLSSVVVYTAGSRGADVAVPGLVPGRARALRDRLRDLAVASEAEDAV